MCMYIHSCVHRQKYTLSNKHTPSHTQNTKTHTNNKIAKPCKYMPICMQQSIFQKPRLTPRPLHLLCHNKTSQSTKLDRKKGFS